MRKYLLNGISIIAVSMFSLIFAYKTIQALDGFPNPIYIDSNTLISYDGGGNIYKKHYYTEKNGQAQGKAYCSLFWSYAPGELGGGKQKCTKENWHSDPYKNGRIASAIGAIVKAARSSDGTTTWKNYYYAELAINRFLYKDSGIGNASNNYAPPAIINSSKFKNYYKKATDAYSEYDKQYNLKINVGNIAVTYEEKNGVTTNVNVKSTISCKKGNTEIDCPNNLSVTIKIGSKSYNVSKKKVGKKIDVSAQVTSLSAGKYTVSVNASSSKDFYQAQRYNCGSYSGYNLQKMVPNLVKNITISKNGKNSKNIEITKVDPPTCESELKQGASLSELYKKYKYTGLLNAASPSCENISSDETDLSCGESKIVKSQIKTINDNYLYCIYSYQINSGILKDAIAKPSQLIYQLAESNEDTTDRRISIDLSITCNAIGLSNTTIDLKNILPEIKINIFKKDYLVKPQVDMNEILLSNNVKSVEDGKISYSGSGNQQFSISGTINYDFEHHYSIDKVDQTIKENSKCNDNCISLGAGIPVTSKDIAENSSNSSTISIVFDDSMGFTLDSLTCKYSIENSDNINNAMFRTIDTSNPFLDRNGKLRYTGTNWCGTSLSEIETEPDDDTNEIEINKEISSIFDKNGRLLGDISGSALNLNTENGNPAITYYDVFLLKVYSNNKELLTTKELQDIEQYGDINQDGKITQDDAEDLFNELTNYFITSDAALMGYGNRTSYVVQDYIDGKYGISNEKIWWQKGSEGSLKNFLYDYSGGNVSIINNIFSASHYSCDTNRCQFNDAKYDQYIDDIMNYMITTYTYEDSGVIKSDYLSNYKYNEYSVSDIVGNLNQDSKIDMDDLEILQNYLAGMLKLTVEQQSHADVNQDGDININDVTALQKIINNFSSKKGDINLDGHIDMTDFNLLNQYIFYGADNNVSYVLFNADIDGDKDVDIYDLVRFRDYLIADKYSFNNIDSAENKGIDDAINLKDYNDSGCTAWTSKNQENKSIINSTVEKYITKREDSNSKKEPLYSFTLTPDKIKEIRDYNKDNSYNDFKLTCTNGYNCISDFVTGLYADGTANVKNNDKCSDRTKFCEVTG